MKNRKKTVAIWILMVVSAALMPMDMEAQRGWGRNSPYCNLYTTGEVTMYSGEVVEIGHFYPENGASYGVELTVRTTKGLVVIHLGPNRYMERQRIQFTIGDEIKVLGALVDFDGRSVVMAREVEKGNEKLSLRDKMGRPVWRRW